MSKNRFIEVADELLRRISEELTIPMEDRPSGVDSADLEFASEYVQAMKKAVAEGPLPTKTLRHPELSHMVIDHWAWPTELGTKLTELEDWYRKL